jgi:hypothetical protein
MAIFGTSGFGFIYPSTRAWGSTTATTGQFDFIPTANAYVPVYDFNNTSVVRQESVINGHVEYVNRGNRQIVKITMHSVTSSQITQLLSVQYKTVRFRPHTDSEDLEYIGIVTKVTPFYLKNINCLDHVSFEIESQEFVELVVAD